MRNISRRKFIASTALGFLGTCGCKPDGPPSRVPLTWWTDGMAMHAAVELDRMRNGLSDGKLYSVRLRNMAKYSTESLPVKGFYGRGFGATIDVQAAPTYYVASKSHPRRPVTWMTNNGYGPPASPETSAGLQQKFMNVPVPVGRNGKRFDEYYGRSIESASPDRHLVIFCTETFEMWEMWLFSFSAERDRYEMGYGGYVPDVRAVVGPLSNQWGARATSIPLAVGIMQQAEYAAGSFGSPLAVGVPVVKDGFLFPASRQDAILPHNVADGDSRDAVPEGSWFRLPADFIVDPARPLLWRMVVDAVKKHGMVVVDGTGGSVSLYAESPSAIGTPYSGLTVPALPPAPPGTPSTLYWGDDNILNSFPWDSLEQIALR